MKKILTYMAIAFIVFGIFTGLTNGLESNVSADLEYDYSYMEDLDFNMGNEYINYTHIENIDFVYEETFVKPLHESNPTADYTTSMLRIFSGDFVKYKNEYYKFFFDNTDTIKLFKAHDINAFRTIDISVSNYQDLIEVTLSESFTYTNYRMPLTFMNNETLYLIMNDVGTGNMIMYNVSTNGTVLSSENTIITLYDTMDELYPQSAIYKNDTFYLFYNAYEDGGSNVQYSQYAYGDSLTNLTVNSSWVIDDTLTGFTDTNPHHIKYYSDVNSEYLYMSYSTDNLNNYNANSEFNHIVFEINGTFENLDDLEVVYWENGTDKYSYNYIPVGFNLYRLHHNINTETISLWHYRGENDIKLNYDLVTKVYWNGLMEFSSYYNESDESFSDLCQITQLQSGVWNVTFPRLTYYFKINQFTKDYKNDNINETMFNFNFYIKNEFAQPDFKSLQFAFYTDYMKIYEDNYMFVRSNEDYFAYSTNSQVTGVGLGTYPSFTIQWRYFRDIVSYEVTAEHNPTDLTDVLIASLISSPIETKLGYIALITGAVLAIVPKLETRYRMFGLWIFVVGIFLLTGLGILGLIL